MRERERERERERDWCMAACDRKRGVRVCSQEIEKGRGEFMS